MTIPLRVCPRRARTVREEISFVRKLMRSSGRNKAMQAYLYSLKEFNPSMPVALARAKHHRNLMRDMIHKQRKAKQVRK